MPSSAPRRCAQHQHARCNDSNTGMGGVVLATDEEREGGREGGREGTCTARTL
jgi:hypothetical protein